MLSSSLWSILGNDPVINDGGLGLLDTDRLKGILTGDLGDLDLDLDLDLLFLLGDLESELDLRGDFDRDLCLDLGGVLDRDLDLDRCLFMLGRDGLLLLERDRDDDLTFSSTFSGLTDLYLLTG